MRLRPPARASSVVATLALLALVCGSAAIGLLTANAPRAHADSPASDARLSSLVATERAFSDASVERGMRDAFMSYLAEDAVIFRPGPINGMQSWQSRTSPKGTLIWEPSFAEVSAAGDLGYDTGPWEYRPPADSTGVVAPDRIAYGHFVTVWKRLASGEWRALDLGIGHDKSEPGVGSGAFTAGPDHAAHAADAKRGGVRFGVGMGGGGIGVGAGIGDRDRDEYAATRGLNGLLAAEHAYGYRLKKDGAAKAYPLAAAKDVRFYREGSPPSVGLSDAIPVLEKRTAALDWKTVGHGISASTDLGYIYGLLELREKGAARPDTSVFVHVWRKDSDGKWRLALDIENE